MITAAHSAAHAASAPRPGAEPPSLPSIRIRPSRPIRAFPASALVPGQGEQARYQPERQAVPGLPRAEQVAHWSSHGPAPAGRPVEHRVGERVAGKLAQVGDAAGELRLGCPAQHAGQVHDRIGEGQVGSGHGGERVIAGDDSGRRGRPAVWRRRGEQARRRSPGGPAST